MPNLNKNLVVELAEKYIKEYNLHKTLEYKIQYISFNPSPTRFSDEATWEICYDVHGWDDLQHSIIISDTEKIVLYISNFYYEMFLPKKFSVKEKKLTKREKRLKRNGELDDYTIDSYAFISEYPCIYVDFNEMITDNCILLSQNSIKADFWGNSVLLYQGLKVIGYMQDENIEGIRDDLIVFGTCVRNNSDEFLHVRWLLKFHSKIYFISEIENINF